MARGPRHRHCRRRRLSPLPKMATGPRFVAFEHKRDANGFVVRPQHLQQYDEYADSYKEEEEARWGRWKSLLPSLADFSEQLSVDKADDAKPVFVEENAKAEKAAQGPQAVAAWKPIRASLTPIEHMMSLRVEKEHQCAARLHRKESFYPLKEELRCLVHGGLPMDLRGEIWEAFLGVRVRRVEGHYDSLLALEGEIEGSSKSAFLSEKWMHIKKDLPRTFPGHPCLDEDGRTSLRRLLEAYARHAPEHGCCQALNVFAGLLLVLMPEENAFWTLVGIIDCFNGYFSEEEMIESQVDQLVLEELVQEKFPKLANHLEYLGLKVPWFTEPWFLSIFTNVLPWEAVLRVWDVLLFDGNRVMLFQTALALLEIYGPSLMDTKHACDAVALLRSLASSTFDSNQLVLKACEGYQSVSETGLQELRKKYKSSVIASVEEMARNADKMSNVANTDSDKVIRLKFEFCQLHEEIRSAFLRADELKTAMMEVVKQDIRCELSAKVQHLASELCELRQALSSKQRQEQENSLELMYLEKGMKIRDKLCVSVDQDAVMQRYGAIMLQEREIFAEKDEESNQQKALISPLPSPSSSLHCRDSSVVVKITEQLVVLCDSGTSSLSSAELRGVMKVNFPANIDPFVGIQISNQLAGMTIEQHPSASQEAFLDQNIIRSEYQSPFPLDEFTILRWRKFGEFSALPLEVEADVHHYHHGCYIQVNYRSPGPIMLKDVLISMPIPFHHQRSLDIDISKDKGKCIIEENQIVWHVPPIDMSNISGNIRIKYTSMAWPEEIPINVRYSFVETCGLKVDRVFVCNDDHSLHYTCEFIGTAGYTMLGFNPNSSDDGIEWEVEELVAEDDTEQENVEEGWSEDDIEWEDG